MHEAASRGVAGYAYSDVIAQTDVPMLMVGYGFGASFVALFMQVVCVRRCTHVAQHTPVLPSVLPHGCLLHAPSDCPTGCFVPQWQPLAICCGACDSY